MKQLTAIRLLPKGSPGIGKLMALRKASSDDRSVNGRQKFEQQQVTLPRHDLLAAHSLLTEIRDLLEEYGPTWYSEELSDKMASVLATLEEEL